MASGVNDSPTNVYLAWAFEYSAEDGSEQGYVVRRYQFQDPLPWLSLYINSVSHFGNSVIGIAPGNCTLTESDINHLSSDDDESVCVIPNLFQLYQEELQVGKDVAGNVVCILDDIWSTRRTQRACQWLVTEGRAIKVCLLAVGETLRFHMIPYRKSYSGDRDSETLIYLKMGTVYNPQRKEDFLNRVFTWIERCIEVVKRAHPTGEVMLAIAPGHAPDSVSFMTGTGPTDLNLTRLQSSGIAVIANLLQRHKKVEKQATSKGRRSPETHLNSIKVVGDVADKIVCILDDVWTSGSTLSACCQLVAEQGAAKVYLLAIGETVQ